jgi:hypothetical protein
VRGRGSPSFARIIDPGTSIGEILFGLIMTLTFTLGAGIMIEDEGRQGVRELLIAVLGCNLAWGFIDAAFYLIDQLFERGRRQRIGQMIRHAPSYARAESLVAAELDDLMSGVVSNAERTALYRRIIERVKARDAAPNSVTRADVSGALASGMLVIGSCLPASIPFLLLDDARLALRVSNAILLASLFLSGFWWARHTLHDPWRVGFAFLVGGVVLVGAAILLGG